MRANPIRRLWVGLTLATQLTLTYYLIRARLGIPRLSQIVTPSTPTTPVPPKLSVIVPARNEADQLREAATSILRQDYPALELILVDDRSTDGTGAIMAELAATHPDRVRIVTVEQLPPGWLGKNHALWVGARRATGVWLLFTDADVIFEPGCFRQAVAYAEAHGPDHLALYPQVEAKGYWLEAFVSFFVYGFLSGSRPYLAADPRSDVGIGIGGFNLLRRTAYETIGTHRAISLRPDDDLRLGRRVKLFGLRQGLVFGVDLARVEWYPTLTAAVVGVEKGMFPGLDYSLTKMAASIGFLWLTMILPYLAVWRARGLDRRLLLASIGVHTANYLYANQLRGRSVYRLAPVLPLTGLLLIYMVLRSAYLALTQRGIRWRDTLYPLDELRGQTGLERGTLPASVQKGGANGH